MSSLSAAPRDAHVERPEPARATLADLGLGVVSISRDGVDGVSYVARLVARAVADLQATAPWTLDLMPAREGAVTPGERLRFFAALTRAQASRRVDALMFTHLGPARAQRRVPRRWRTPYGVFVHGVEMSPAHMTPERLEVLAGATIRVANSHFTARRVESLYPSIGPVSACPLALLPDATAAGPANGSLLASVADEPIVLLVGRMSAAERYKGHDQLIEAWPSVVAAVPRARLVFVGAGDDVDRLRARAVSFGVGERVTFTGRIDDATLAALLSAASVFAMPSAGEGFGLVYLEAMRAGLPCIASPDDGGAEVVVDGDTGLVVPQHDRPALVGAVVKLLRDPALASSLGDAGRRRFESRFTYEHFRDRLAAILGKAFVPSPRRTR